VTIAKEEAGKYPNEQVMARAKELFTRVKPRPSGAGNYSAAQLIAVYENLKKEG
jgi:hypothetical protein